MWATGVLGLVREPVPRSADDTGAVEEASARGSVPALIDGLGVGVVPMPGGRNPGVSVAPTQEPERRSILGRETENKRRRVDSVDGPRLDPGTGRDELEPDRPREAEADERPLFRLKDLPVVHQVEGVACREVLRRDDGSDHVLHLGGLLELAGEDAVGRRDINGDVVSHLPLRNEGTACLAEFVVRFDGLCGCIEKASGISYRRNMGIVRTAGATIIKKNFLPAVTDGQLADNT